MRSACHSDPILLSAHIWIVWGWHDIDEEPRRTNVCIHILAALFHLLLKEGEVGQGKASAKWANQKSYTQKGGVKLDQDQQTNGDEQIDVVTIRSSKTKGFPGGETLYLSFLFGFNWNCLLGLYCLSFFLSFFLGWHLRCHLNLIRRHRSLIQTWQFLVFLSFWGGEHPTESLRTQGTVPDHCWRTYDGRVGKNNLQFL